MEVPSEFRYLVDCFHQDSLEGVADEKEWIATTLEFLDEQQKSVVREFLNGALAPSVSESQLRRIWDSSDPDFQILDDGELRSFLQMIRDRV